MWLENKYFGIGLGLWTGNIPNIYLRIWKLQIEVLNIYWNSQKKQLNFKVSVGWSHKKRKK